MVEIISGGQSGMDRAALAAAIELGLLYGGWCPKGGWAEDFPNPPGLLAVYPHLRETPSADPLQRTEWNVRDADQLLILIDKRGLAISKGSMAARDFAVSLAKPHKVIDLHAPDAFAQALAFVGEAKLEAALCIAGSRESEAPGIYAKARPFLCAALGRLTQ
ncbi:MAG TPA: putative molybdenum carrier protein [Methyloceanibacter sp.]|nr:putative molybdenum carrier protein [Methyloceanibacter sp.]